MTYGPHAVRTARRNLVLRVERFIRRIAAGLQPDVDVRDNLVIALECLEREDYTVGEDAMMLAEKDWPPRRSPVSPPKSIAELIKAFERLRAEG